VNPGRSGGGTGTSESAQTIQIVPLEPFDLLLSGVSSSVAVYAAAASLASDKNANFFMWAVLAGTLVSSMLVWLFGKSKLVLADTTAYTVVALTAAFGISSLNDATPDPIYTGPLVMAGILSWMLVMGSFTVWRDQTMLFQAVPAIALFGLVGCYDTFRASVVYFFIFLICEAILLSRAHGRAMLRQARSSGAEALEMSVMRKGPWRSMAGPEWALASALTIVLISTVGAPILRNSASGFSGLVHYTPPVSPLMQSSLSSPSRQGYRVGQGPTSLTYTPVLRVSMPRPMYLRSFAYGLYERGTWMPLLHSTEALLRNGYSPHDLAVSDISDPLRFTFKIEPIQVGTPAVPLPGELLSLSVDTQSTYFPNFGGSLIARTEFPYPVCEGQSVVSAGEANLGEADFEMGRLIPEYLQQGGLPQDVVDYAHKVTQNARTDYDKALAIKQAIERGATYNLNAKRTPDGADPVSYFLFQSREGYCDLFASSMTLMARAVGLPARYVTGFYPFTTQEDSEGRYVIKQNEAHAWCEIFFKNGGWVVFDATEGAAEAQDGSRGSINDRPFWAAGWFLITTTFAGAGLIGYLGFLGAAAFKRFRIAASSPDRRLERAQLKLKARLRRQYLAFERDVRRAIGRPRRASETIFEYTATAQASLLHRSRLGWETGNAFVIALYDPGAIDTAAVDELEAKVRTFKHARRSKAH